MLAKLRGRSEKKANPPTGVVRQQSTPNPDVPASPPNRLLHGAAAANGTGQNYRVSALIRRPMPQIADSCPWAVRRQGKRHPLQLLRRSLARIMPHFILHMSPVLTNRG